MRRGIFLVLVVFLGSFAFYLARVFPSVAPFRDAGDLIVASHTLGIAHPPGYPTYVLANRAWLAAVPWGHPGYRVNAFSALCGALTNAFCAGIGLLWFGPWAGILAAFLAGTAPALSLQYQLSEMYGLHALWAAVLLWLLSLFHQQIPTAPAAARRTWAAAALFFGLGLGNHQSLVLLAPLFLWGLWAAPGGGGDKLRLAGVAALGGTVGVSILIFPWVRSRAGAAMVWGEPQTLTGLLNLLLRHDYGAGTLSTRYSHATAGKGLAFWLSEWLRHWGTAAGLAVLAAGVILIARRRTRPLGILLGLAWLAAGPVFGLMAKMDHSAVTQAILEPALGVPLLAGALMAALALGALSESGAAKRVLAAAAAILIAAPSLPALWAGSARRHFLARDYGLNLLRTVPPNAALITISDYAAFCVSLEQQVFGRRPDVAFFVDVHLPWRWRQWRARYPDYFSAGQPDNTRGLIEHQAARHAFYSEGLQDKLLDLQSPYGLGARIEWPARTAAALDDTRRRRFLWDLYTRRPPPADFAAQDYYTRELMKNISIGAFNAAVLLSDPRNAAVAHEFETRSLAWDPQRLIRAYARR